MKLTPAADARLLPSGRMPARTTPFTAQGQPSTALHRGTAASSNRNRDLRVSSSRWQGEDEDNQVLYGESFEDWEEYDEFGERKPLSQDGARVRYAAAASRDAAKRSQQAARAEMMAASGLFSSETVRQAVKAQDAAAKEEMMRLQREVSLDQIAEELAAEGYDLEADWEQLTSRSKTTTGAAKARREAAQQPGATTPGGSRSSSPSLTEPVTLKRPPTSPKIEAMRKELKEMRRRRRLFGNPDDYDSSYDSDLSSSGSDSDDSSGGNWRQSSSYSSSSFQAASQGPPQQSAELAASREAANLLFNYEAIQKAKEGKGLGGYDDEEDAIAKQDDRLTDGVLRKFKQAYDAATTKPTLNQRPVASNKKPSAFAPTKPPTTAKAAPPAPARRQSWSAPLSTESDDDLIDFIEQLPGRDRQLSAKPTTKQPPAASAKAVPASTQPAASKQRKPTFKSGLDDVDPEDALLDSMFGGLLDARDSSSKPQLMSKPSLGAKPRAADSTPAGRAAAPLTGSATAKPTQLSGSYLDDEVDEFEMMYAAAQAKVQASSQVQLGVKPARTPGLQSPTATALAAAQGAGRAEEADEDDFELMYAQALEQIKPVQDPPAAPTKPPAISRKPTQPGQAKGKPGQAKTSTAQQDDDDFDQLYARAQASAARTTAPPAARPVPPVKPQRTAASKQPGSPRGAQAGFDPRPKTTRSPSQSRAPRQASPTQSRAPRPSSPAQSHAPRQASPAQSRAPRQASPAHSRAPRQSSPRPSRAEPRTPASIPPPTKARPFPSPPPSRSSAPALAPKPGGKGPGSSPARKTAIQVQPRAPPPPPAPPVQRPAPPAPSLVRPSVPRQGKVFAFEVRAFESDEKTAEQQRAAVGTQTEEKQHRSSRVPSTSNSDSSNRQRSESRSVARNDSSLQARPVRQQARSKDIRDGSFAAGSCASTRTDQHSQPGRAKVAVSERADSETASRRAGWKGREFREAGRHGSDALPKQGQGAQGKGGDTTLEYRRQDSQPRQQGTGDAQHAQQGSQQEGVSLAARRTKVHDLMRDGTLMWAVPIAVHLNSQHFKTQLSRPMRKYLSVFSIISRLMDHAEQTKREKKESALKDLHDLSTADVTVELFVPGLSHFDVVQPKRDDLDGSISYTRFFRRRAPTVRVGLNQLSSQTLESLRQVLLSEERQQLELEDQKTDTSTAPSDGDGAEAVRVQAPTMITLDGGAPLEILVHWTCLHSAPPDVPTVAEYLQELPTRQHVLGPSSSEATLKLFAWRPPVSNSPRYTQLTGSAAGEAAEQADAGEAAEQADAGEAAEQADAGDADPDASLSAVGSVRQPVVGEVVAVASHHEACWVKFYVRRAGAQGEGGNASDHQQQQHAGRSDDEVVPVLGYLAKSRMPKRSVLDRMKVGDIVKARLLCLRASHSPRFPMEWFEMTDPQQMFHHAEGQEYTCQPLVSTARMQQLLQDYSAPECSAIQGTPTVLALLTML